MLEVYRKLFALLDARERRRFVLLIGVMIAAALAELVSISAVLGLLNVLAEPGRISEVSLLNWAYETGGFTGLFAFQVALSVAVVVVVMAGLGMKALGTYAIIRYSEMRGYAMACRLLSAYLQQPYSWFLGRNSSDIAKSVLAEVSQLVGRGLIPALRIVANVLVAVAILGFLLAVDSVIAPLAGILIGGGYALIYLWLRPVMQRIGADMLEANAARYRMTQEATGGFKEIKLLGLEDSYMRRFEAPARRLAKASAVKQLFGQMPRYALEGLTFAVLLGMVLVLLLRTGGNIAGIVPTLGIFAFATLRLLPALQQIYQSLASLRVGRPVLDHIHREYTEAMARRADAPIATNAAQRLQLIRALELDRVSYAYPAAARTALQEVSLTIPARSTVGIVGGTGAGKTTLVDLLLGLLTPDGGTIRVDGTPLGRENLRAWQRTLGYVPQSIYLTDDTVAANIAFGVPPERVDRAAVERAARIAALHEFVTTELPQGYDTRVGERGVRLSGGQRQRIGIARALYRDPTLLILDEATSALDNLTERAVMEAVANIRHDKTIILIAHRLTTVRNCDMILLMEHGRIVDIGTYDRLVAGNDMFRRMATGT